MRRVSWGVAASLGAALTGGCANAGGDRLLGIEETGVVAGVVYFDGNATRELEADEERLAGVGVGLVIAGTRDTVASATSDGIGRTSCRERE